MNTSSADESSLTALDENRLMTERRNKLDAWREIHQAFPNTFRPTHTAAGIQEDYAPYLSAEDIDARVEREGRVEVSLAGRMMSIRVQGKISFVTIQDNGEQIQLFVSKNLLANVYDDFKTWDIGDIVGVQGTVMRTRTGELTVRATELVLLTKGIRSIPTKTGLTDTEIRYRQRYVDLVVNRESRDVFIARSKIVSAIRHFMENQDFLEVETPMMHPIPGGASAEPFVTHHNALNADLYLRIAPELYLKRLVVGGMERVFEINRSFRNEGVSTRHNPEFTMIEVYQAYSDYVGMMDLTENLVRAAAQSLPSRFTGMRDRFVTPFRRIRMDEIVLEHHPTLTLENLRQRDIMAEYARLNGCTVRDSDTWGHLLLALFETTVESTLIEPTFVTHYPLVVSPLARVCDSDFDLTDRFEFFVEGRELANGFSELNDPEDQARRFQGQAAAHEAGDAEAMHYDADYIRALEYGMPPTGGMGMGIDRLVMVLTNSPSIRDVLYFPQMRGEH